MRFAEPHWLVAGLAVLVVLTFLLVRAERLRSRALRLLEGARLRSRATSAAPSALRRWSRVVIAVLAIASGFVALARPEKGMHWETVQRNGVDLMVVVDTSKSMDVDDVKPTRLERAKLAIHDLVDRFPGDRVGLVAFAGDAFVQSPMTLDHEAFDESLDALDTSVIARGGTNIGKGIDAAADALASEPGRQKIMVLLSDGEDLEGQGLAEAKRAHDAGIQIDTIGVGTAAGELVPARDARGRITGVMNGEDGAPVRSKLDEEGLRSLATAAGGTYRPLGADGRGLDHLYDESLAALTHAEATSRTHRVYAEWFEVPLAFSLFGIVLDALLARRWRGFASRSTKKARAATPRLATAASVAAAVAVLFAPIRAHASVADADKAFAAGHYEDAAKSFEAESANHPKDARLAFNAGDAAYRAGKYDTAQADFDRALKVADPTLQERVLYNKGDVLYRQGAGLKPDAKDATIAKWKDAITSYEGALALNPKDADAEWNRDFVKRKLAALEQQKKEPPKDPKSDDQKDKKNGDDKQQGKSGAGDQDKKDGKSGDQGDKDGKSDPTNPNSGNGKDAAQDGKDGKDAKDPSGGANPSQGQNGAKPPSAEGSPNAPPPAPSGTHAPGAAQPPSATGATSAGQAGDKAAPGQLSAQDARALLSALKGDERHHVSHGTDAGAAPEDAPRKDW